MEGANLRDADLRGARLALADLQRADLSNARLEKADLQQAELWGANLSSAHLQGANLAGALLGGANLTNADLSGADLRLSNLVEANLSSANLHDCRVHGASAWSVITNDDTDQTALIISLPNEPTLTVDHLMMAQFMFLLLHAKKPGEIIDTLTSKVVLILGRFTSERKEILDDIRDLLRGMNYLPMLFDFDKPRSKDTTGTVEFLARMARFIIADLTDPSSIPHELATIVPLLRTTPVLPVRLSGATGYSMFADLGNRETGYPWVLPIHEYKDRLSLKSTLPEVVAQVDKKAESFRTKGQ